MVATARPPFDTPAFAEFAVRRLREVARWPGSASYLAAAEALIAERQVTTAGLVALSGIVLESDDVDGYERVWEALLALPAAERTMLDFLARRGPGDR